MRRRKKQKREDVAAEHAAAVARAQAEETAALVSGAGAGSSAAATAPGGRIAFPVTQEELQQLAGLRTWVVATIAPKEPTIFSPIRGAAVPTAELAIADVAYGAFQRGLVLLHEEARSGRGRRAGRLWDPR